MAEFLGLFTTTTGTPSIRTAKLLNLSAGDTPQGVSVGTEPTAAQRTPWHRWYNTTLGQWMIHDDTRDRWLGEFTRQVELWAPEDLQQKATAVFTFSGNPSNGNTIEVGAVTYTWTTSAPTAINEILVGSDAEDSARNLVRAVTRGGPSYANDGTTLVVHARTFPNPGVWAWKGTGAVVNFSAMWNGQAGNAADVTVPAGSYGAFTYSGSATATLKGGGGPAKLTYGDAFYRVGSQVDLDTEPLLLSSDVNGETMMFLGYEAWGPETQDDTSGTNRNLLLNLKIAGGNKTFIAIQTAATARQRTLFGASADAADFEVDAGQTVSLQVDNTTGADGVTAEAWQGTRIVLFYTPVLTPAS